jgi:hypothetical protein
MYEFYIQSFHISYEKNIFYSSTSDKISAFSEFADEIFARPVLPHLYFMFVPYFV